MKTRSDFPMLTNNPDLVYLNNAATTFKPKSMIEAMDEYYEKYGVSAHKSVDSLGWKVEQKIDECRQKVASFVGACESSEIIFTRSCTTGLNMIARSLGDFAINEGDEILVSPTEHHANFLPWQELAKRKKAVLKFLPTNENGEILVENLEKNISDKTKIVAVTHVSNVMGATNNIKKLAGVTHQHGAYLVVDGAQAVSHLNINVQNLDCDFYIFSAHKMCGPTGIGIIYGKKELLEKMEPVEYGGEMVSEIDFENDNNVWQKIPNKFEAGTALTAEIFGLSAAIDYLNQIDLNNIHQHIVELRAYAVEQLKTLPNIKIYNEENIQTGIITFNHLNVHPHDAASVYDKHNVSLRAGHQCSMGTMEFLGVGSVLRASFYFYNTKEDVDKFIEATKQIDNYLEIITS